MRIAGAAAALLFAASGAGGAGGADTVVARVGDAEIRLSEIDARSLGKVDALLARIETVASGALDQIIDARLLAHAGAAAEAEPVSDESVEAFLRTHPEFFNGPGTPGGSAREPSVQLAAVRHFLEREARAAAEASQLERLRAGAQLERLLPARASLAQPLPPEQIVARVDAAPVRASEVERLAALRLYRGRGELHRERERSLGHVIEQRLLADYARRSGAEPAALVEAAAGPPIDAAAVEAYVRAEVQAGRRAPQPERARPYLEFRRRQEARERVIEAAREKTRVEVRLTPPAPPVLPVDTDGAPWLGGAEGAPRLVVYANYRCVQCRLAHEQIDRLLAQPSPPRIVLRDFIPPYDPAARTASSWLRCAAEQERHGTLRKLLLTSETPDFAGGWLGGVDAREVAARIGASPDSFLRCVRDPRTATAIDRDTQEARRLGFDYPPAFVAEGRGLSGVQSAETLDLALRDALE